MLESFPDLLTKNVYFRLRPLERRIVVCDNKNARNLWESAKAFLYSKRDESGLLSAEDTQSYERMESEVVNLGKEIDRLERQVALDLELSKPVNDARDDEKKGRASNEYRQAFCKAMLIKTVLMCKLHCKHVGLF